MGNVTLIQLVVGFIHLIWYFTGLLSQLSLLVLSASISRLAGFGVPTRLFTSIFLVGAILMILFPFQPQYEASHEYYENVNGHSYEVLKYHLYRLNRPPIIGNNYSIEIGRKTIEKDLAILRITFDDTIVDDDETISTVTGSLSVNETANEHSNAEDIRLLQIKMSEAILQTEPEMVEISKDYNVTQSDLLASEKISEIQPAELHNEDVKISEDVGGKDSKLVNQIWDIELSDEKPISDNELVSKGSSHSNEIHSIGGDTIERIESVVSIIEPDLSSENSYNQLSNTNSRELSEVIEEFLSVIETNEIDEDIL